MAKVGSALQGHPAQSKIWEGLMAKVADHQELAFGQIEYHLPTIDPSKDQIYDCIPMSFAKVPLVDCPPYHNIISKGLD